MIVLESQREVKQNCYHMVQESGTGSDMGSGTGSGMGSGMGSGIRIK